MKTNIDHGLSPTDFAERERVFGSNQKAPLVMTPYWKLFLGALEDFMLRFLLVCAVIDLAVEVGFAKEDERSTCKHIK